MIFRNDFICFESADKILNFSGSDREELYEENLKKMPQDWVYRDYKKITYKFNSLGFRCEDISNLDFDNYVLFTGCSHTEGVGLALEDTYPYQVSKKLGCDYFNLAIGGTGIDILEYNLITWFLKHKKKPKYVFIQWPDHSRYTGVFPNYDNLIPIGNWYKEPEFKTFIASTEITGNSYAKKVLASRVLRNIIDVPIIDIQFSGLNSFQPYDLIIKIIDFARDRIHSGIQSNYTITKQILNHNFIWRDMR